MMPTGKMAGLGDALCPVPVAFRRGVEPEAKAQLLRPGADIRMVGGHLRRMAPHAHHVPRAPLVHDRPVLNASATSHVRSEGMTPDDRIHQRLAPATNPMLAPKVSQVVARTPMPRAATTLAPVARLSARTPMQTAAPMRAPERHYEAAPHYQTASRSLRGDGGVVGGPKIPLVPIMPVASQIRTALAPMPGSMNLRLPSGGIVSSSGGSSDTTGAPSAPACPAGTVPLPDGSGCACAAGTVPNADGTACVSAPSGGGSDAAHGPSGGVNPLVWVGLAAVLGGVYWMTQSQEH
jgi:hypothetical protein